MSTISFDWGATHVAAFVPAANQCLPSNNILTDALGGIFTLLTGAFGGLLLPLSVLMFVMLVIIGIVLIKSDASGWLKAAVMALLVPIGAVLAMVIQHAAFAAVNSAGVC